MLPILSRVAFDRRSEPGQFPELLKVVTVGPAVARQDAWTVLPGSGGEAPEKKSTENATVRAAAAEESQVEEVVRQEATRAMPNVVFSHDGDPDVCQFASVEQRARSSDIVSVSVVPAVPAGQAGLPSTMLRSLA